MKDILGISWLDQCKYCLKAINTTHCSKNQKFMDQLVEYLSDKNTEYVNVECECEFFSLDNREYEKINVEKNE